MPKASKPNGFLNFMICWKQQQEKLGRKFPNGIRDVQADPECNNAWKKCSQDEKNYYKNMTLHNASKKTVSKKTGIGEELESVERKKLEQQQFKDTMTEEITTLVNKAKETNGIQKLQFYVIHVNFFYSYKENNATEAKFHPAEIAIAEFSLEKGVTRIYNQIINEKIRLGYTGAAQEKSCATHQIPLNSPIGKNNYTELFRDIYEFIKPGCKNGKLPPIYTMHSREDVYEPAKSVLERLAAADGRVKNFFVLYSFEEIFSMIHNAIIEFTGDKQIEPLVATIAIKKDPFAFKKGLTCEYHTSLEAGQEYCSQSIIQRWIYVLCSHCCEAFDIELIPGAHKPQDNTFMLENSMSFKSLNSSVSSMYVSESKRVRSTVSMTGVSNEHRERVSQRSYEDEKRRRAESTKSPIEIVNYSQTLKKVQEPVERPLRTPFTKSAVIDAVFDSTDTESLDFSDCSFPSIGRGAAINKKFSEKNVAKPGGYDRFL